MSTTNRRLPAKKVLEAAKKHAGKDVIVVSNDRAGNFYLATSMPSATPEHIEATLKLVQEAAKTLRRYHRRATREHKSHGNENE